MHRLDFRPTVLVQVREVVQLRRPPVSPVLKRSVNVPSRTKPRERCMGPLRVAGAAGAAPTGRRAG